MGELFVPEQASRPVLHIEVRLKTVPDNVIVRTDIVRNPIVDQRPVADICRFATR